MEFRLQPFIIIMRVFRLFITICLTFSILLFMGFFAAFAGQKHKVYFHNPESNINNYALLKMEFDKYLSDFGAFEFQPISDRKIFERQIIWKTEGVFLISSWHYERLSEEYPMEAVLVGVSNGKTIHKKILCAKEDIASLNLLDGRCLASSGSEDYTKSALIRMLGEEEENIINSMKILTVPKDIDALMAVGFGMADFALTTEKSLIKLEKINLKQYKMLGQLLVSDEILLPVIAVTEQPNAEVGKLLKIIEKMGASSKGKKILKMIGLDGWRKPGIFEIEYLDG